MKSVLLMAHHAALPRNTTSSSLSVLPTVFHPDDFVTVCCISDNGMAMQRIESKQIVKDLS